MSLGDIGTNIGRAVSNGVHNAGQAMGNAMSTIWGKIASAGAKLSTVPVGPLLVGGSLGVGLITIGTATISSSLEPGVYENYYDSQNAVASYMEELKEDGSRDVELVFSSTNAAVKAYYSVMSGKTLWQLQEDGTVINATDINAKKDYFDREPYLFLTPNFLYALNETIYNGNSLVYPEQFIKPVAFSYEDEVLELQDLVKDNQVQVKSNPINLTTGKRQKKKEVASVSDYGLGSVAKYKQDTLTRSLEGTYIKQDVWDDATLSVVQQDIEEDFVYVISTDEIDVLESAVTVAGVVSFDYTVEKQLSSSIQEGKSDNIADAVTQVLYATKQVIYISGQDKDGNIVRNVTKEWCKLNGYTPIYKATIKNSDGSISTVSDVTEEWAKENGYMIVIPPPTDVKLYKYRSADSGIFSESCTPVENQTLYEDVDMEYLQDYLLNFETYFPTYKSRIYGHLEDISTVANVEAYQKTAESTNGTGTQKADFIESIKEKALEYQKQTGISAAVIIAQACLESGALNGGSALSNPPNNNYFGIKAFSDWKGRRYNGWTTEVYHGVKVRVRADFRAYDEPGDCFEDYCKLIWNQTYGTPGKYRYRDAAGKGWLEAITIIVKGGYCTDPEYVSKIEDIVKRYNLEELEKDPNYQWDGTPPAFAKSENGSSSDGAGDTDGTLYKYTGNLTKEETDIFNDFLFRFVEQDGYTDNQLLDFAPNGTYRKYKKKITSGEFNSMLLTVLTFTNHTLRSEEDVQSVSLWYDGFIGQKRDKDENTRYVGDGDWWWVVPSSFTITSKFGPRSSPTAGASSYHKGIDIAANQGADVIATRAGKVIVSQFDSAEGNWIAIDHGDGFISMYMHNSKLLVKVGEDVEQGQVIAKIGSTGVSTGPHLHFAIKKDGEYVNPEDYISPVNTPTKESSDGGASGSASSLREAMVKWAVSKVGNHYIYGGTNPNCKYWGSKAGEGQCIGGTDCSGFMQAIYKEFGMPISRTAASQCSEFKHIQKKDLLPGDLLFYRDSSGSIGHVSMYIGGNKVVHASSSSTGIVISNIGYRTPAFYGRCKTISKAEKSYKKQNDTTKEDADKSDKKESSKKKEK